jgi:hypothetical protein
VEPLRVCIAFLLLGGACSGGAGAGPHPQAPDSPAPRSQFAEEDRYVPPYGKPELSRALIAERGAEATAERVIAELEAAETGDAAAEERLRTALADLGVRRRFIASLEACEAGGRWCPPRLDDPPWSYDPDAGRPAPLEAPLRFDLASWQKVAAELHGRACACRTIGCVDSVGAALDQLEGRPMPEVQDDDAATVSITRARECLFRLRGKAVRAVAPREAPESAPASTPAPAPASK